ncbi:unnamed protein product [Effrenium voratum]|uniref:GST C-terminal domain-containing protein n=1 Tax=Effrenium voratum TaxID=2562239 RepID=A0AA36JHU6_9DINO|nr:unnamed protein product [Effrenium voratum]
MKLYAHPDNYKTKKALIAAEYVGLEVSCPQNAGAAATGKIPVLETPKGCIFSSTAIARYISRISRPVGLYGQNLIEGGMIDSWLEFSTHELEVPLCTWVLPAMGVTAEVPEATACAKDDVAKAMTVLDKHCLHNTFMVGNSITLADISVCCALIDAMRHVFDGKFLKPFPNLMRWFKLCVSQPEFAKVLGKVAVPEGQGGKEAKEGKEGKAKGEKAEAKAAPKKAAKKEATPKKDAAPKEKGDKKKDKGAKTEEKAAAAELSPEEIEKQKKAKLKKVLKEGGKRGVEIEGAADMGGLQFFCTSVDEPEGDIDLLTQCVESMNAKSDPSEEERKGGSGHIGKMVFSVGVDHLAVLAYVPDEKLKELNCQEWLKAVLDTQGGEVVSKGEKVCTGKVKTDADKGRFPLKIREPMILEANNFLRKKGLFPEDNDDDDDEMVFGDDDFPSM